MRSYREVDSHNPWDWKVALIWILKLDSQTQIWLSNKSMRLNKITTPPDNLMTVNETYIQWRDVMIYIDWSFHIFMTTINRYNH